MFLMILSRGKKRKTVCLTGFVFNLINKILELNFHSNFKTFLSLFSHVKFFFIHPFFNILSHTYIHTSVSYYIKSFNDTSFTHKHTSTHCYLHSLLAIHFFFLFFPVHTSLFICTKQVSGFRSHTHGLSSASYHKLFFTRLKHSVLARGWAQPVFCCRLPTVPCSRGRRFSYRFSGNHLFKG